MPTGGIEFLLDDVPGQLDRQSPSLEAQRSANQALRFVALPVGTLADLMKAHTTSVVPWWSDETAIPLPEVPSHLPRRRNGQAISLATVYRWTSAAGIGGQRLRRFRPAGARGYATTLEELARFAVAMTAMGGDEL